MSDRQPSASAPDDRELRFAIALTRLSGFNAQQALQLYRLLGSARAVYEQRACLAAVVPGCSPRLADALRHWDDALARADAELEFMARYAIDALTPASARYPDRLRHVDDAPLVLYYRGTADLSRQRIVAVVGTRHCTPYGQDLVQRFVSRLSVLCPGVLVVSGLAYGVDICAHRQALAAGCDTVGVLAHGLDTIYPARHRETALAMLTQGGLLTEYMTQTEPLPNNFRQRNRIVAGMSDVTLVVESASRGGALITARIAQEYGRDVMAFPGPVGAPYSEGCNNLIRDNRAALITSADDLADAMGWQPAGRPARAQPAVVERQLFPDLTAGEQAVVGALRQTNDLQLNQLAVRTNIAVSQLTALLFQLELKGVVRPLAGGVYHLLAL